MKWSSYVIDDLRKYIGLKQSIQSLEDRLEVLKANYAGIKGNRMDSILVHGSGGKREDNLISIIVEKRKLKRLLMINKKTVEIIEKGLNTLTENEKTVLYNFFIIRKKGHVEATMEELNIERSQVYRLKEEALEKLTRAMFGIAEL